MNEKKILGILMKQNLNRKIAGIAAPSPLPHTPMFVTKVI